MDHDTHRRIRVATALILGIVLFFSTTLGFFQVLIPCVVFISVANVPDIDSNLPFFDHRGFSHTVFAAIVLGVIGYGFVLISHMFMETRADIVIQDTQIWGILFGGALSLSYIQHIIEDMVTKGGGFSVRPFWPLSSVNGSIGFLKYDSIWFTFLSWILFLGSIVGSLVYLDHLHIIEFVEPISKIISKISIYLFEMVLE